MTDQQLHKLMSEKGILKQKTEENGEKEEIESLIKRLKKNPKRAFLIMLILNRASQETTLGAKGCLIQSIQTQISDKYKFKLRNNIEALIVLGILKKVENPYRKQNSPTKSRLIIKIQEHKYLEYLKKEIRKIIENDSRQEQTADV